MITPAKRHDARPDVITHAPLRTIVEIVPEPASPAKAPAAPEQSPRPTIVRTLNSSGLFQGWGPRIG